MQKYDNLAKDFYNSTMGYNFLCSNRKNRVN